jgi:hypothetical protein
MRSPHQSFRVLPVITLILSLLPVPAQAQFSLQTKLVGTGFRLVFLGELPRHGQLHCLSR